MIEAGGEGEGDASDDVDGVDSVEKRMNDRVRIVGYIPESS